MHYYKHSITDYRADTGHLSLLEHGVYRQLMDSYYLDEKPIETQLVMRRLKIKSEEEKIAFENILSDFFEASECGNFYLHKRIDQEVNSYQGNADKNRENGKKGGRPRKSKGSDDHPKPIKPKKTQPVIDKNPSESEKNPNQEPLTINQKPNKNNKKEIIIPDFINRKAWLEWVDYRKKHKTAVTQAAAKKQFNVLKDYPPEVQAEIIDSSIQNDYQGLFRPKAGGQNEKSNRPAEPNRSILSEATTGERRNDWAY